MEVQLICGQMNDAIQLQNQIKVPTVFRQTCRRIVVDCKVIIMADTAVQLSKWKGFVLESLAEEGILVFYFFVWLVIYT